jgi:hypothetical protein
MHGLFSTWTQKSHHLQVIYYNIYTTYNASFNQTPCSLPFRVYLLGEPTSLLVVANTHPLLSLVCQQLLHPLLVLPPFHTPQIKLPNLHRRNQQHQASSSGAVWVPSTGLWQWIQCSTTFSLGKLPWRWEWAIVRRHSDYFSMAKGLQEVTAIHDRAYQKLT